MKNSTKSSFTVALGLRFTDLQKSFLRGVGELIFNAAKLLPGTRKTPALSGGLGVDHSLIFLGWVYIDVEPKPDFFVPAR